MEDWLASRRGWGNRSVRRGCAVPISHSMICESSLPVRMLLRSDERSPPPLSEPVKNDPPCKARL